MINKTYRFETFTCPSCTMKIEGALRGVKGIEEYDVQFNSSRVKVKFHEEIVSEGEIINIIESLGFKLL